jgi:hypothetical protein
MHSYETTPRKPYRPPANLPCALCGIAIDTAGMEHLLVPGSILMHDACNRRQHEKATACLKRQETERN